MNLKKCIFSTGDNKYAPKCMVALLNFKKYNSDYDMYLVGTSFDENIKNICGKLDINIIEKNLSSSFIKLNNRKNTTYPIECYYLFYAQHLFNDYNYAIYIDGDIYTNKKLTINLNTIKYIGGSEYGMKIKDFPVIKRDLKKLQSTFTFKNASLNNKRIQSGFLILNIINITKIDFFKKVVTYYKRSLSANVQRDGDDSLLTLFQIIHPEYFIILNNNYNLFVFRPLTENNINIINHFHFTHNYYKPWDNNNQKYHIGKYFNNLWIKFLYDNFDLNFIKIYFPTKYRVLPTQMNFYYYDEVNNFGDLLTKYFLNKFGKPNEYRFIKEDNMYANRKKILGCGSIYRLSDKKAIVYGSGIRDRKQNIKHGIVEIVRGPITRQRIYELNGYCPPTFGDPGLLLPLYYNPKIDKQYKLGIIPHHTQYEKVKIIYNNPNILIVKLLNSNIESTINDILKCEKIVSSSLHGLIVSDAYNIPNKWIQFDDNINGDNTKYYDYFQSVKRKDQNFINAKKYKKINHEIILNQINPINIIFDKNKLKDMMFFDEHGIKNYTKYLYSTI